MNKYTALKDNFAETQFVPNESGYINLDKSKRAYFKIKSAMAKPLKLVLFYGKPGSGKSFLLQKLSSDLARERVIYLPQPLVREEVFFATLHELARKKLEQIAASTGGAEIGDKKPVSAQSLLAESKIGDYHSFVAAFDMQQLRAHPFCILLDEAQLYPEVLIEKIRLLSDTLCFKFLFTVHQTAAGEQLLAQEHFATRIWESIELAESSETEISLYLGKKLCGEVSFSSSEIALLTKLCRGNLRTLNMLIYSFLEICEFYEAEQPIKLAAPGAQRKIIEMAALAKGLLHA